MDRTDRRILRHLQTEPDVSISSVGDKIGVSQATCSRRIQRMREEGIIPAQTVVLDRKRAGFNTMVFAQVKLSSQGRSNLAEFSSVIKEFPEVMECYVLLGSSDFLLRIVTKDMDAYEKFFFEKLSKLQGVQEITSSVALSEIKHTSALPI